MKFFLRCLVVIVALLAAVQDSAQARSPYLPADDSAAASILRAFQPRGADSVNIDLIPWPLPFGIQQTGMIDARFDCFGMFGRGFSNGSPAPYGFPDCSFETPALSGNRYLFGGAIWIGGIVNGDTLVSEGCNGWQYIREMNPEGGITGRAVTPIQSRSDNGLRAEFTDTVTAGVPADPFSGPFHPLRVRLANRSYVWRTSPCNSTVLYDLVVTNIGDNTIQKGWVGFYFDGDVYAADENPTQGAQDDVTGTVPGQPIGYIIDNSGKPDAQHQFKIPKAFAFKIIAVSFDSALVNYNWWIPNGNPALDYGPQTRKGYRDFGSGGTGTPEGNRNKYYILSNPEWDFDQVMTAAILPTDSIWMDPKPAVDLALSRGFDTRFLMSIGPVDLTPGASVRIISATFTGDSVHTVWNNSDINLFASYNPVQYEANLNFADLIRNGARSDTLAESLLAPKDPVVGLRNLFGVYDSVVVSWDPYVFPEVTGYNLYLSELDPTTFPHPGVVPPWISPSPTDAYVTVPHDVYTYTFKGLDPDKFYAINAANSTTTGLGQISKPVFYPPAVRWAAPTTDEEYVFAPQGGSVTLTWQASTMPNLDHYNIYRFADSMAAKKIFHAFYDRGYADSTGQQATDSTVVDGHKYFYYEVEPHGRTSASVNYFSETVPAEGTVYVISAVDRKGYESDFSKPVSLQIPSFRDREILVITNSTPTASVAFVQKDTIAAFYQSILTGHQFDLYSYVDSTYRNCPSGAASCLNWHDLSRYSLVIVDDGMKDVIPYAPIEDTAAQFTKYMLSGGKLAYFGSFRGFTGNNSGTTLPHYFPLSHKFLRRFFAIDSTFDVGVQYYYYHSTSPFIDTSFGFHLAEPAADGVPGLVYDTTSYPFYPLLKNLWPTNTPPSVSTFKIHDSASVLLRYRSLYPATSQNEGFPVGVQTSINGLKSYAFGFHLWYMDHTGARQLVEYLLGSGCCQGLTGNIDGDPHNQVDISDLQYLLDFLFLDLQPPACRAEANTDGDPDGIVDISDVSTLLDFLFRSGNVAVCR